MTSAADDTSGDIGRGIILRVNTQIWSILALLLCAVGCGGADPSAVDEPVAADMETAEPSDPEAIRPFAIDVPEEVLTDLRLRLSQRRLPDQIP